MDTTVTETIRHSLTVSDSDFQLTLISGPTGAASTVAGPTGPAGAAGAAGANGAAGPNSITSATTSDGNATITVSTLGIGTSLTMNGDQSFVDGKKAIFGAGSDLQIYHDNTQSRIQAEHNDLWIVSEEADKDIVFYADSGTGGTPVEYIRIDGGDEVTKFSKSIQLSDNVKIQVGASQDLEIYHESGNSYIDDKGAGNLNIRGANLNLQKYTGETFVTCVADGAVSLYHDNASKLSTSATGIAVTGGVSATGNISTTNGNISITSGNIVVTSGGISTQSGNISTASGNISTGVGNITVASGNITTTLGNVAVGTGNVSVTNGDVTAPDILASADLGYSSGGAVTQGTSITTAVTLNTPSGVITCLPSGTYGTSSINNFTLTNSTIGINDVVVVSLQDGNANLSAAVTTTAAGSCNIAIINHSTSAAASSVSLKVNFAVIKVATS